MTATSETTGSCLCGAVRYQITGPFERFFLCHCSRCRKGSGSAHGANIFSSQATLAWLSGEDSIRTYRVPESRHARSFCVECGSGVPQAKGNWLMVPAGSLDSAIDIRPDAHICCSSRAEWDAHLEDVPSVDGMPG
ncbi:GFA family protein [Kaistia dalseonensis]|uniref:CENP-V/GFA domain-containing protein n=1 Tax=Kaistia dalseonensis TaxID=410840 RepID=A0ABU0H0K5_9HYPH|nr:GFA family protein [Kaistia dalseonensis]MCX5493255.1 GFA family protein [Kaistia dalseonensis]MDQ0435812.1 hypothetical protein [Kaistia dalseonensis]